MTGKMTASRSESESDEGRQGDNNNNSVRGRRGGSSRDKQIEDIEKYIQLTKVIDISDSDFNYLALINNKLPTIQKVIRYKINVQALRCIIAYNGIKAPVVDKLLQAF